MRLFFSHALLGTDEIHEALYAAKTHPVNFCVMKTEAALQAQTIQRLASLTGVRLICMGHRGVSVDSLAAFTTASRRV